MRITCLMSLALLFSTTCKADVEFIPISTNQLFQNFGEFSDTSSGVFAGSMSRMILIAGEVLPVFQVGPSLQIDFTLQYTGFVQVNSGTTFSPLGYNLGAGLEVQKQFSSTFRASLGYSHFGSHLSEGTPYSPLFTVSAF